jgi:excisionase family DNA binding protein
MNQQQHSGTVDPARFGLRKAAYSINETCEQTRLGRNSIYKLIKDGVLRPIRVNRRTTIGADDIAALLAARRQAAA